MKVSMLDPVKGNAFIQKELEDAALDVLQSGQFVLGETVETFEQDMTKYLKVKDTVAVSSGTDALLLSLMALGINPGDEVICPSFTFFATAGAIARIGAKPVFVDIDPVTFNIDVLEVKKAITPLTAAIIPVHLFGQAADIDSLLEISTEENIPIIEDCAQAIGAKYKNNYVGSFGSLGCFSFFPSKNLGGFGDAGLVTTKTEQLAKKVRLLRVHGCERRYFHSEIGGNFRMDALQASMLTVKLKHLKKMEERRQKNAQIYLTMLKDTSYILPLTAEYRNHTYNQFTIRVQNNKRDSLVKFLNDNEIGNGIYYPLPLHNQKCFTLDNSFSLSCIQSEKTSLECLSIPVAPELTKDQIEFVAEKLIEFDQKNK